MTAVTTASAAWVECAAITGLAVPLYLAFIFRTFLLERIRNSRAGKRIRKWLSEQWPLRKATRPVSPVGRVASPLEDNHNYLEWSWPR